MLEAMRQSAMIAVYSLLLLTTPVFGGSAIDYDLNSGPTYDDQLLGINDPTGSWGLNRFSVMDLMGKEFVNTETLTGNKTLTTSDYTVQVLDPNGAGRSIYLPAEASSTNMKFTFVNTGEGIQSLRIRSDDGTTLDYLHPDSSRTYVCDGTTWYPLWPYDSNLFWIESDAYIGPRIAIGGDAGTQQTGYHSYVNIRPSPTTETAYSFISTLSVTHYVNPATNSSAYFYGVGGSVATSVGNTANMPGLVGGTFLVNHKGTGDVADAMGCRLMLYNYNGGTIDEGWGGYSHASNSESGTTMTNAYAHVGNITNYGSMTDAITFDSKFNNYGTGTITNAYGLRSRTTTNSGTIGTFYGFYSQAAIGTITNTYGVYLEDQTVGSSVNYSLYSAGTNYLNKEELRFAPLASDHTFSGKFITATAGESVVIGDVCYLKSDEKFWKIDATAEATTKGQCVMATASIGADASGVFMTKGLIRDDSWNWTAAQELWAPTTPGNLTSTKPTTTNHYVRLMGWARDDDHVWFEPDQTYVKVK